MDLQETIDLRSDNQSRMPLDMLKAMSIAKVGDDVFEDDPTAHELQNSFARLFNKQAALFFPTTIMANTATVLIACRPGEQILTWSKSHVVQRQCSTLAMFGGVLTRQIFNETGVFKPQQISKMIRKKTSQVTFPDTSLFFAQNPSFNGNIYNIQDLKEIKKICSQKNVHLHVDGARIFNAIQFYKCKPADLCDTYDTMSISLNKSLCCPFGSILLGSKQFIRIARTTRKSLGGGMRQIGVICAAGLYALKNTVPQLKKDHQIALYLGNQLSKISEIEVNVNKIKINMVFFNMKIKGFPYDQFQKYLKENNIKIKPYNTEQKLYRVVIYMQIRQKQIDKFVNATKQFIEKIIQ